MTISDTAFSWKSEMVLRVRYTMQVVVISVIFLFYPYLLLHLYISFTRLIPGNKTLFSVRRMCGWGGYFI